MLIKILWYYFSIVIVKGQPSGSTISPRDYLETVFSYTSWSIRVFCILRGLLLVVEYIPISSAVIETDCKLGSIPTIWITKFPTVLSQDRDICPVVGSIAIKGDSGSKVLIGWARSITLLKP